MTPTFEQNLQKYAALLVHIGIHVVEGDLVQVSASLTDDPNIRRLVHYVVEAAYQAGATYVAVVWHDDVTSKLRVQHSTEADLDYVPDWSIKRLESLAAAGVSRLGIRASDPALFADVDHKKVMRMQQASQAAMKHIIPTLTNDNIWMGCAAPSQSWADRVFADVETATERRAKLWDAIFAATRIYEDDPIRAWREHQQNIIRRRDYLTGRQYTALHFSAEGTDLTVGLPDGHIWAGGAVEHDSGRLFTPNIPTEEMFTMPHRERVNGTVRATKPLSVAGNIIEDFSFVFQDGRVVDIEAETDADILRELVATDMGAAHLGEVALVPHSSPISQTGLLFFNTLYDENASCHVALGRAYAMTLNGGKTMSEDELIEAGANVSQIHVDFMIGSATTDIDGIRADGSRDPIFRQGEWAFEV